MNSLTDAVGLSPPPLGVYVHLPWCLSKCPYCDFNSHAIKGELPADRYVDALLLDLEADLPLIWGRTVHSVFIGGGTPSLFPARQIERLLDGLRARLDMAPGAEVTLEANPGAAEHDRFVAYRDAGVNRISLGIQSFDDDLLRAIGRIHGRADAVRAVESVIKAGFERFNLDLMFALPGQSVAGALDDVKVALDFGPPHVSHYQLTLEPNTLFHARPPVLPDEDTAWAMQEACSGLLSGAGLVQYEVSAWSKTEGDCLHNLNYWRYGDFVGIGAGAHGKLTLPAKGAVHRRVRLRHPRDWMAAAKAGEAVAEDAVVPAADRAFEFFLNQLRLRAGVLKFQFTPRTGLPWSAVESPVDEAISKGLLEDHGDRLVATDLGWRFVNEIQALFLPV
jgi:oxygen-independent coproporphyrinogen-3 oxidase